MPTRGCGGNEAARQRPQSTTSDLVHQTMPKGSERSFLFMAHAMTDGISSRRHSTNCMIIRNKAGGLSWQGWSNSRTAIRKGGGWNLFLINVIHTLPPHTKYQSSSFKQPNHPPLIPETSSFHSSYRNSPGGQIKHLRCMIRYGDKRQMAIVILLTPGSSPASPHPLAKSSFLFFDWSKLSKLCHSLPFLVFLLLIHQHDLFI